MRHICGLVLVNIQLYFQSIFCNFFLFYKYKSKFMIIGTEFWIKRVKFQPPRYNSLLLHRKSLQRNWLRFSKYFKKWFELQGLMKLKLLRERYLFRTFQYQKVTQNEKMIEGLSFNTTYGFLTQLLTLRQQILDLCGHLDCFSLTHFFVTSNCFQNMRPNWSNFGLTFG